MKDRLAGTVNLCKMTLFIVFLSNNGYSCSQQQHLLQYYGNSSSQKFSYLMDFLLCHTKKIPNDCLEQPASWLLKEECVFFFFSSTCTLSCIFAKSQLSYQVQYEDNCGSEWDLASVAKAGNMWGCLRMYVLETTEWVTLK